MSNWSIPISKYHSYLNTAVGLLSAYGGEGPFSIFAKDFFSSSRKYGSRDRKWISHLCYCFFRLGKTGREISIPERILAGLFLCSSTTNEVLSEIRPHWNDAINLDVESKFSFLASQGFNVHLNEIFPSLALSRGIEPMEFFRSMFVQPDLFVRIRPGLKEKVLSDLKSTGIEYRFIEPRSVAFPNSVRLQDHLILDREVVVQDLSSQETWNFIPQFEKSGKVWDCCAASGGKSFLIKDKLGNVSLLVSDIRSSILANLGKRFRTAGLTNFEVKQLDLRNPGNVSPEVFDLVVADVPCTGSGTWSRTPEQLYFFKEDSVKEFRQLQTTIAGNIVQAVKPGGYLLYITCSVFYGENEGVVDDLTRNAKLELLRQETIRGYNDKADTMFASLLQKVRAV